MMTERSGFSRRRLLTGAAVAGGAIAARPFLAMGAGPRDHTLVHIFLRGGFDGIGAVRPRSDGALDKRRGRIYPAEYLRAGSGRYEIHPALAATFDRFRDGDVAFVHGVGHPAAIRSHFDAQDLVERGVGSKSDRANGGWMARLVGGCGADGRTDALAIGTAQPLAMAGIADAAVFADLDKLDLPSHGRHRDAFRAGLDHMYGRDGAVEVMGTAALDVSADLSERLEARSGAYPATSLGRALEDVARTLRAGYPIRVASIDVGGWDIHSDAANRMHRLLGDLDAAVDAFWRDLRGRRSNVTVVILSEFGRRLDANANGGFDHGSGGLAMVWGKDISGGRVHGRLGDVLPPKALADANDPVAARGDQRITVDFRDLLAEVATHRMAVDGSSLFPKHRPRRLGVV